MSDLKALRHSSRRMFRQASQRGGMTELCQSICCGPVGIRCCNPCTGWGYTVTGAPRLNESIALSVSQSPLISTPSVQAVDWGLFLSRTIDGFVGADSCLTHWQGTDQQTSIHAATEQNLPAPGFTVAVDHSMRVNPNETGAVSWHQVPSAESIAAPVGWREDGNAGSDTPITGPWIRIPVTIIGGRADEDQGTKQRRGVTNVTGNDEVIYLVEVAPCEGLWWSRYLGNFLQAEVTKTISVTDMTADSIDLSIDHEQSGTFGGTDFTDTVSLDWSIRCVDLAACP